MSSGCISTRPIMPWCCVSMKNRRFRLSTAHSPCCRCSRAKPRATRIPIAATGRPRCLRRSTRRVGRSSDAPTAAIGPTYSSWLNLVERWFAELTTKQLRRGTHRSVRRLEAAIWEFLDTSNAAGKPFVWTKSADEILASIARFAQRTLVVHN